MKKMILMAAMSMTLFGGIIAQAENNEAREVSVNVSEAFVPSGFDSQTDAYIVISGIMPNGCYRWARAEVKHNNAMTHDVTAVALVRPGVCPRMLVPFSEEVKLGKLARGTHQVKISNGDGTYFEKKLIVE